MISIAIVARQSEDDKALHVFTGRIQDTYFTALDFTKFCKNIHQLLKHARARTKESLFECMYSRSIILQFLYS